MTPQQIQTNKEINRFLQKGMLHAMSLEKAGKHTMAVQVLRTTSVLAEYMLTISGVKRALHEFWLDKKSIGRSL